MSHFFRKYTILPTLCLAGVAFAFATPHLGFWSGLIGTVADIGLLYLAASVLVEKNIVQKTWIDMAAFLLSYIILATILYFFVGLTPLTAFFLDIILYLIALQKKNLRIRLPKANTLAPIDAFALAIFAGQLALFQALFEKATDIALGSPWLLTGNKFFALYGLVLLLLFYYQWNTKNRILGLTLLCIQGLLTLSVAAIIYKLGFGYDPLLHRAAESFIFEHGVITPKTPFYIGQYVSVIGLAFLTHLPLKFLDIILVPLLAGTLVPWLGYISFRNGFGIKENIARVLTLLITLFPLQYFIVTTPHNLATLFTFIAILLVPLTKQKQYLILFSLVVFSALAVHPLSGIFAFWLWVGVLLYKVHSRKKLLPLYILLGSVLTPLMLATYNVVILGQQLPPISNFIDRFPAFLSLFQRPYYFINRDPDFIIQSIYIWQWIIPVLFIGLAVTYWWKNKKKAENILLLFPFMIFINIFFLSTWIVSPELGQYEQIQYAERLRHLLVLFILPLGIAQIGHSLEIKVIKNYKLAILAVTASTLLVASWYLTYPQRNEAIHFPGYNATAADFETARIIAETPEDIDYIVLSNILTAGASIEQFGFTYYYETEKGLLFHYPIPSGSPLYQSYSNMLYEGQKREFIDEALSLTNTDRAYFLVHDYWAKAPEIVEGAKKTADSWKAINDGQIWLFEYNR